MAYNIKQQQRQRQEEHEANYLPESNKTEKRQRLIYQVDEGHKSQQTAYKYRVNFRRFLDSIGIHDLDVLLDQGKEVLQEMVMKYTRSLRDSAEKK